MQEGGDRVQQAEARALGVRRRRLRKVGEETADLGEDGGQLGAPVAELGAQRLGLAVADVGPQRLHPGPVGRRAAGLPAAPDAHPRTPLPGVIH